MNKTTKRKNITLDKYLKSKTSKEFQLSFEETKMHLKIARLVEELRLKKDLTQTQLAKKAGVSQPMIARIEKGDQDRVPTLSTINKILNALGHELELVIKAA